MTSPISIGLIGDYDPAVRAHQAIPHALAHAAADLDCPIRHQWLPTPTLAGDVRPLLNDFAGLWCVPASPYQNMAGALNAIRYAREQGVPFLGTCGGFQHAVIEFARSVLGQVDADHAETNPGVSRLFITPLSCSLVGKSGTVRLLPGSRAADLYGCTRTIEHYHCNFGMNSDRQSAIHDAGLRVTGVDEEAGARIVELDSHPFFVGTLFQPELRSSAGQPHPIIHAFAAAAVSRRITSNHTN